MAAFNILADQAGMVIRICAYSGVTVKKGDPLIIIEVMKMEIEMTSPFSGDVISMMVQIGTYLEEGQVFAVVQG